MSKRPYTDRFGTLVEIALIENFSRCVYWGHVSHFRRVLNPAEYADDCRYMVERGCGGCTACQENGPEFFAVTGEEMMWPQPGMDCDMDCTGKVSHLHEVRCHLYRM